MQEEVVVAEPVKAVWWYAGDLPWLADRSLILAPYIGIRPGYEFVDADACETAQDQDLEHNCEGYCQICLWEIGADGSSPGETDEEIWRINQMQRNLGPLDDDTRYIRIQIACLARCYFTFPANVNLVLEGIGKGRPNLDARISCEQPWNGVILPRLRLERDHPAAGSDVIDSRRALVRAYLEVLTCWASEASLDYLKWQLLDHVDLAETIYRRLGTPTKLKLLYVRKLCWMLGFWAYEPGLRRNREKRHEEISSLYDSLIQEELDGREDVIGRLIDGNARNGSCHHGFFRHIDHQIAAIGAGQVVRLPGAGQERRRIHRAVTNYVHALGSWLAGRTRQVAIEIWPPSEDTVLRAYSLLGDATPTRRWLAACLWKKLRSHHADLGRGALDAQPWRFAIPLEALTPHECKTKIREEVR